jgi:hypothetical protein
MLNPPMKSWGFYELARQRAQEFGLANRSQPPEPNWAIGSMEWQAEQEKAAQNSGS